MFHHDLIIFWEVLPVRVLIISPNSSSATSRWSSKGTTSAMVVSCLGLLLNQYNWAEYVASTESKLKANHSKFHRESSVALEVMLRGVHTQRHYASSVVGSLDVTTSWHIQTGDGTHLPQNRIQGLDWQAAWHATLFQTRVIRRANCTGNLLCLKL